MNFLEKAIKNKIDALLPTESLFDFWGNMRDTMGIVTGDKRPSIHKSNVAWFDMKFGLPNQEGMPFGTWIIFSGPPGSSKTTNALVVADGFGQNPDVEWHHYDSEMGQALTEHFYKDLGIVPDYYESEPDPLYLIEKIIRRAKVLELEKKSLVVVIDSFKMLGYSLKALQEAALAINSSRKENKNLLWITINHMNKSKQIEGPANVVQLCDTLITTGKRGPFRYLSASAKNRYEIPGAPETIKLTKSQNKKPQVSLEPDFISESPIVVGARNLWHRFRK